MNIKINIFRTNSEEWSVKAYASIVFDDKFKVTGISIRENSRGNLFVSMPSYRSSEVGSDGKATYRQFCHPTTKEFNKELSEAILRAYREGYDEMGFDSGTDQLSFYIKVNPLSESSGNVEALVTVIFNRKFAVNGIRIVNGANGKFIAMPSQKKSNAGAGDEYVDVCYPVTKEFREMLYENIFRAYLDERARRTEDVSELYDVVKENNKLDNGEMPFK